MKNAWKLFNYGETPIYLKYWFLALFLFIPINWVISLFISIVVHEISHARTAKKLGYKTDYIFIDILHGGAMIDGSYTKNDKHSISIAFAGPLSNLILALLGFLIAVVAGIGFNISDDSLFILFIANFISINLLLFVMNLIPIYPLDGGRISKSIFSMLFGKEKGQLVNGVISFILSSLVLIYSIYQINFVLIIISFVFLVASYFEIKPRKDVE